MCYSAEVSDVDSSEGRTVRVRWKIVTRLVTVNAWLRRGFHRRRALPSDLESLVSSVEFASGLDILPLL